MSESDKSKLNIVSANFPISFCLNPGYDENKNAIYGLKIQGGDFWELNIIVTEQDLELVSNVKTARWDERSSLKIGKCLGAFTFWSRDRGVLSILVGYDDECWEFGVSMNEDVINDLMKEIDYAKKKYVKKDNKWIY